MAVVVILLLGGGSAVQLAGDRVGHVGQLFLLLLKVLSSGRRGVLLEPVIDFLDSIQNGLLVILVNLATETVLIVDLVLQAEGVVLQAVARLDLALDGTVLLSELFSFGNHAVNLLLGETTLVIGDSDRLGLAGALVTSTNLQDTVGVQVKRDLDLGNATRGGRNASKFKLAKNVVVLGEGTLSFDCRLLDS